MGDTSSPSGAPFSPYLLCTPATMGDTSNPIGAPFSPYLFCAPADTGDTRDTGGAGNTGATPLTISLSEAILATGILRGALLRRI
ncbi:MAG: hypothetical protein CRN43_15495 [Candidatus Nephrothrix sp. EaCA]|nr:MAG: hypothetical protein CRN43_15495 [Candidatus Nephrothrix sp. EaCA]